jgi:hypothetical protein
MDSAVKRVLSSSKRKQRDGGKFRFLRKSERSWIESSMCEVPSVIKARSMRGFCRSARRCMAVSEGVGGEGKEEEEEGGGGGGRG